MMKRTRFRVCAQHVFEVANGSDKNDGQKAERGDGVVDRQMRGRWS